MGEAETLPGTGGGGSLEWLLASCLRGTGIMPHVASHSFFLLVPECVWSDFLSLSFSLEANSSRARSSSLLRPIVYSTQSLNWEWLFFFKVLFIFREEKGGRKRERQTSMCGCLSCAPIWGPGQQPRHVPWLGIEPVILWFTDHHSIHWATPARAECLVSSYWPSFAQTILLMQSVRHSNKWHIPTQLTPACQLSPTSKTEVMCLATPQAVSPVVFHQKWSMLSSPKELKQ